MIVCIDDIVDGMETASPTCDVFLNMKTGDFLIFNEYLGHDEEAYAEYEAHEDDYLGLPSSHDIHEYRMMEQFITTVTDDEQANTLWMAIDGSGAFRKFKDTVYRYGIAKRWFAFREERYYAIGKRWCADNNFDYFFEYPESVLSRRKLVDSHPVDAPADDEDIILQNGIFQFNITQLLNNIDSGPWNIEDFEEVKLKVDDWIRNVEDEDEEADDETEDLSFSPVVLLEFSPDRRLITPDDPSALRLCSILVDKDRRLLAAKRAGQDTLDAYFIPMEVHEAYICKNRAEYTEYWNSKLEDATHDIKLKKKFT